MTERVNKSFKEHREATMMAIIWSVMAPAVFTVAFHLWVLAFTHLRAPDTLTTSCFVVILTAVGFYEVMQARRCVKKIHEAASLAAEQSYLDGKYEQMERDITIVCMNSHPQDKGLSRRAKCPEYCPSKAIIAAEWSADEPVAKYAYGEAT